MPLHASSRLFTPLHASSRLFTPLHASSRLSTRRQRAAWQRPLVLLAALAALTCPGLPAHAGTVVSNLGETNNGSSSIGYVLGFATYTQATAFTTGPATSVLESVTASFRVKQGNPANFKASLYTNSSGVPGSKIVDLSGSAPDTAGNHTYTCPNNNTGCNLAASTTYHLVFSADNGGDTSEQHTYSWNITSSDNETRTPSNNGWTIADTRSSRTDSNSTWQSDSDVGQFSINASINKTLAASSVEHDSATLTIGNHTGNWYYQYTSPSGGACSTTAVSTTTSSVTGLTGNTSYTFKAYSNSSCSTELAAAPAFLTKPAKPGKPTATAGAGSGKLTLTATLAGGSGALSKWEYTKDNGTNWTAITTDTDNSLSHVVTGLTDGTNYTFKVRATNATGTGPASDASDAARPSDKTLAASAVTHDSATLTIGNHTGNWYYQYTAPPGGSCSSEAVTGASTRVTGLAANTTYTFAAYSNSTCSSSTRLVTAAPFSTRPRFSTRTPLTFRQGAIPAQDLVVNAAFSLTLPAARGGAGAVTYTLTPALPQGLTFNPETRTLRGTPTQPQPATTYTYTATDTNGHSTSLTFTMMVPDLQPTFGTHTIGDRTYVRDRAIETLTLPAARGGNGRLTYALTPAPPPGLTFDAATRTLRGTPAQAQPATRYTYTVTDADATDPDRATLVFRITVRPSTEKEMLEDVLAAQGRALLSGATGVIGARFRNPGAASLAGGGACSGEAPEPDEPGAGSPPADCTTGLLDTVARAMLGLSGAGGDAPAASLALADVDETRPRGPGLAGAGSQPAWDWESLLWGRSFALPLNAQGAPGSAWTLWGAGDIQGFEGTPRQGQYDGQVRSLYLGVDAQWQAHWLAGAALARSWGETEYVAERGGREGQLKTTLTSIYPYVRGTLGAGLEVWAIGGYGRGEAENTRPGRAVDTRDLTMAMGATGARQPMTEVGGVQLAVVGGAGYLSLATEGGDSVLADLDVAVNRARLAVEATWTAGGLAPYVQVGGRYDGGAGQTGAGLETVAGVRYTNERLAFEARGRWLAAHAADGYEEYGGLVRLAVKPLADGTGFRLHVAPRWGAADGAELLGGGATLLDGGAMPGLGVNSVPPATNRALVLDSELGYGFAVFEGYGLLTPYGGFAFTGEETRQYRLGTRLGLAEWLTLSLEGSRRERTRQQPADQGVQLKLEGRF